MTLPLNYMPSPEFIRPNASEIIMAEMPANSSQSSSSSGRSGRTPYLADLCEVPLLSREQERHLFRKFNYLKYKAATLRGQLDTSYAKRSLMDQIERLYEAAQRVKNQIVRANLRLVVAISKKYARSGHDLWDLVSEGNITLLRAVEKFDFARGNKLSTYATWAIMRNFARHIPSEQRHRDRFRTSLSETVSLSQSNRTNLLEQERAQKRREAQVNKMLSQLDERERTVVTRRFGINRDAKPQTLQAIGAEMGVSKERIRQIESRAIKKLRTSANEASIEVI
ncbi:MAG: sigma-70 family RNA polymerase sigma factor [Planctomycetaceae bacterium]